MYKYHNLNPISQVGLDEFTKDYAPVSTPETADAILVRSAAMHEMEFAPDLKAIARAGAGVNNIPLEKCAEQGIVVFNTPGANANGVKELVIAGMLLASRDIIGGINWVQENEEDGNIAKDAEKAKKAFAGCDRIKNVRVNREWDQETMIIRQSAFEGCIHLRKVMLNRVIKVEKNAFRNCPQLSECVYISIDNLFIDGGEFIERDAFDPDNKVCVYLGDESNNFKGNDQYFLAGLWDEDYVFEENGVTYVCYDPNMTGDMEGISREHEGTRILDVQDELETVFVKDTNVTGVGRKAFYGSEKIKVVKLGSQNRYIETKAFFDCENLERVYIPDTTNDIADDAFDGCNSLVIYTPKGSYAEKFARKHNIPVVVSATSQDILNDVKPNLRVTKKEKDGVTLKWEISQPYLAEGYEVERKNAQGEYVHCSTIKSSEVNTKDIELWNYSKFYGKNITFRVKAYFVDEDGTIIYSQPSNTVKTTFCPVQPKITSLTKKPGKKLTVKWKKSDYAIGYQVWRSVDGKKGVCIKTIKGGDVTSFTDTNLKEGVTYIYWIKSYRMDYQNKKIYSRSNDYFRSIVY